ncbi:hypothetical protein CerSpe_114880 [Prunus speciosa]
MTESNIDDDSVTGNDFNKQTSGLSENRNEDELLASSIRKNLPQQSSSLECNCIFRIPHIFRKQNENVFVPNLVSIGPFHHGEEGLKAMEEIKQWYLNCLLERRGNQEASLKSFVEGIRSMENTVVIATEKRLI